MKTKLTAFCVIALLVNTPVKANNPFFTSNHTMLGGRIVSEIQRNEVINSICGDSVVNPQYGHCAFITALKYDLVDIAYEEAVLVVERHMKFSGSMIDNFWKRHIKYLIKEAKSEVQGVVDGKTLVKSGIVAALGLEKGEVFYQAWETKHDKMKSGE